MSFIQVHRDCLKAAPATDFKSELLTSDDERNIIEGTNPTKILNRGAIEAFQKDAPLANANFWKSMHVEVYYKHLVLLGLLR